MPSLEQNEKAVQNLISRANNKTGKTNTDLTSAVNSLLAGYGQGGSGDGVPIEVSTEEEMTAILESATNSTVGSVYKYTGETTDTYTSGEFYIVEVSDGND